MWNPFPICPLKMSWIYNLAWKYVTISILYTKSFCLNFALKVLKWSNFTRPINTINFNLWFSMVYLTWHRWHISQTLKINDVNRLGQHWSIFKIAWRNWEKLSNWNWDLWHTFGVDLVFNSQKKRKLTQKLIMHRDINFNLDV